MTCCKQRKTNDEPRREDVEDLVYPADVDAPGINKEC